MINISAEFFKKLALLIINTYMHNRFQSSKTLFDPSSTQDVLIIIRKCDNVIFLL